jgi:hypothetical protein
MNGIRLGTSGGFSVGQMAGAPARRPTEKPAAWPRFAQADKRRGRSETRHQRSRADGCINDPTFDAAQIARNAGKASGASNESLGTWLA